MAFGNSRNQRGYVQKEITYGIIPNTTGTATVGNNNAFLSIGLNVEGAPAVIPRPDKTGTLSRVVGISGRRQGKHSMRCSLAGNAAGVAPDIGPFLEALFGKAVVISAGVSATYGLDDTSPSLSIFNFRTPAGLTQQIASGCGVDLGRFTLGEDVAEASFEGPCKWVLDDDQFSAADAGAKSGLTTFPTEPSAPVTNGNMAVGFTGAVTLDGNAYTTLRTAVIEAKMNRTLMLDVFNNYYAADLAQGVREIRFTVRLYDDDSANLSALKNKAIIGTAMDMILQVGTIAGNIWTFTGQNIILEGVKYDDSSDRWGIELTGLAAADTLTAKNEFALVIT